MNVTESAEWKAVIEETVNKVKAIVNTVTFAVKIVKTSVDSVKITANWMNTLKLFFLKPYFWHFQHSRCSGTNVISTPTFSCFLW